MASSIPSCTPTVPDPFGPSIIKLRSMYQILSNKTPTTFTHKDWTALADKIPALCSAIYANSPHGKLRNEIDAFSNSFIITNECPKEWSALKNQIDKNKETVEKLYKAFLGMDRRAPSPENTTTTTSFRTSANDGSRAVQEVPNLSLTLAYLVQILSRISKGEYGETLREASENSAPDIFNPQTLCKLVLFEATRTLPIKPDLFPEIFKLDNKYIKRLQKEHKKEVEGLFFQLIAGTITKDEIDSIHAKSDIVLHNKVEEWEKLKSKFPAKLQELITQLNKTNDLGGIVSGTGDHTLLNQVISSMQMGYSREDFSALMKACNQISDLSEVTNAFPDISSLAAHFSSLTSGNEERGLMALLSLLLDRGNHEAPRTTQSTSSNSTHTHVEEMAIVGIPGGGLRIIREFSPVFPTLTESSSPSDLNPLLQPAIEYLSVPFITEVIEALVQKLNARSLGIEEGYTRVTSIHDVSTLLQHESLDEQADQVLNILYNRFTMKLVFKRIGPINCQEYAFHTHALLHMLENAKPRENTNGIRDKIATAQITIKKLAVRDMIRAFAEQPLDQITVPKFREFSVQIHDFDRGLKAHIEYVIRKEIKEHHEPSEFNQLLASLSSGPTSDSYTILWESMKTELENERTELYNKLRNLSSEMISNLDSDNYNLGFITVRDYEMQEITQQIDEIKAKLSPGSLHPDSLHNAVQKELKKTADFYRELARPINDFIAREEHIRLHQVID